MLKLKKIFTGLMLVAVMFTMAPGASYAALTQAQINSILGFLDSFGVDAATKANVQAALNGQPTTGTGSSSTTCSVNNFTTTMRRGSRGGEVPALQRALISMGYNISAATGNFGPQTEAAVKAFQADKSVSPASGVVGPLTRAALNGMGCPSTGTGTGTGTGTSTGSTSSSVMAMLATDTPASTTVPANATANFTKFHLGAGATPVTINSLFVTRAGLSSNSDVQNIKIVDANTMVEVGSLGTLNSNNKAQITFTPALTIPANTMRHFFIRASLASGVTAGKTVQLGIASASDIVSSAPFTGSFPIYGNVMSTNTVSLGTLSLEEDGSVSDTTPDVGDTDVAINKFRVVAGSVSEMKIEQIAVELTGTSSASDTANIELYDVSKGQTVATVPSWDNQEVATFANLNIMLAKGETRRFEVRVDILDGAGDTVNGDLTDGSLARMWVKDTQYGYYVTPSITWSGTNGQADNAQTIQDADLVVTRASTSPATGNVAAGSDVHLATFDFRVNGESVRITSAKFDFTLGTMTDSELTNIKLVNEATGALLAGPSDGESNGGNDSVTFTDVMILPVGTTKVKVTGTIANSVSANDTIAVSVAAPSTNVVARGMQSNDDVTATPASNVVSNTLTIRAAALTAITSSQPAARTVVAGQQDFVWSIAELRAGNSGEDVNVSAVVVEATVNEAAGGDSGAQDLDNVEIWADLTSAMSPRGDVFETLVSDTKQFTGTGDGDATLSFTLNQNITVKKDQFVNIAVVADLSTEADANDTFNVSLDTDAGDVTATGATTGNSVSVTPVGAGQTMTVGTGGAVVVSVDASSPVAASVLDDTAAEQTIGIFRLATNNTEAVEIDSLILTPNGTNGNESVVQYRLYNGATLLATSGNTAGATSNTFFFADGVFVIPADSNVRVTVKAVMANVDGTDVVNGNTVQVGIDNAGDVDATGLASGSAINSTGTGDAATHVLFEAYPSFAFQTVTNTVLAGSANHVLARLNITANGNEDVTFESADTNGISFQVTVVGDDTNTGNETLTLLDQDGIVLDTATINSASGTSQVDFDFSTASLRIPAGQTEYVELRFDTSDLEDDGNSIQVWLDDTAADISFGVDGTGDFNIADRAVRGDIYGQTHVNPS